MTEGYEFTILSPERSETMIRRIMDTVLDATLAHGLAPLVVIALPNPSVAHPGGQPPVTILPCGPFPQEFVATVLREVLESLDAGRVTTTRPAEPAPAPAQAQAATPPPAIVIPKNNTIN